jgi:hypothetical protein
LPEERVVDVTTTMKLDRWLELDLCQNIVALLSSGQGHQHIIQICYVGLSRLMLVHDHDPGSSPDDASNDEAP